ncbi:MAG: hypothetical protein ACRD3M_14180 [Thermoanaerobaculia bacterium]
MRAGKVATWSVPAILPAAMLFVPKCPFCFPAMFAAAGSVLPSAAAVLVVALVLRIRARGRDRAKAASLEPVVHCADDPAARRS